MLLVRVFWAEVSQGEVFLAVGLSVPGKISKDKVSRSEVQRG